MLQQLLETVGDRRSTLTEDRKQEIEQLLDTLRDKMEDVYKEFYDRVGDVTDLQDIDEELYNNVTDVLKTMQQLIW